MNLVMMIIKSCMKKKKEENSQMQMEELGKVTNDKEKKYLALMSKLCGRYILMKKRTGEQR